MFGSAVDTEVCARIQVKIGRNCKTYRLTRSIALRNVATIRLTMISQNRSPPGASCAGDESSAGCIRVSPLIVGAWLGLEGRVVDFSDGENCGREVEDIV